MWGMGGWVCCVGRWVGGMLKDDITEVIIMPHWIVGVARYSHYKNDSWYPVCICKHSQYSPLHQHSYFEVDGWAV